MYESERKIIADPNNKGLAIESLRNRINLFDQLSKLAKMYKDSPKVEIKKEHFLHKFFKRRNLK